ncbi:MAG: hypothetical protein GXO89_17435 [Chlorobi bacterium]|nr:hypothetical protein [Chlorobiota bacterium]
MENIKHLISISEITQEDCYQTKGSRPVKVFCSDMEHYVCKYFMGVGPAFSLFNEYIAAAFLRVWGQKVPETAFVKVKEVHVPKSGYPYHWFDKVCFGSFFLGDFKEVDKFFIENPAIKKDEYATYHSFLMLGLFDLWVSNEDRHFENTNMLYDILDGFFIPIDHVQIFNGNNLDKEPYLINEDESILSSPLLNRLFSRTLQHELKNMYSSIENDFRNYVQNCHIGLDDMLGQLPDEWQLDVNYLKSRLAYLFSEDWCTKCIKIFRSIIQRTLNNKR